jgi:hypothetical protein
MLRRIEKEIYNLKTVYPDIDFNLKKISDKEYSVECEFPNNKLNIILDTHYPFTSPKLEINGTNFFQLIANPNPALTKEKYGFDCFCCESCMCSKNWGPAIRLDYLIKQSLDFIEMKKSLDNLKEQRACNYVPDRVLINIGSGVEQNTLNANSNYSLLKELYETNDNGDLYRYQQIYNKFMSDSKIYCFHSYTDHPPGFVTRQFYPLCTCININTPSANSDPEDLLVKIHRGLYELPCNCRNGKRYFALRNAYEIEYKKASGELGSHITYSIKNLCDESTQPIRSPIIDWIELEGPVDKSYIEWI